MSQVDSRATKLLSGIRFSITNVLKPLISNDDAKVGEYVEIVEVYEDKSAKVKNVSLGEHWFKVSAEVLSLAHIM